VRARRARDLARKYPQAAEVLELLAAAYDVIGDAAPAFDGAQALAGRLHAALRDQAPEPLRDAAPSVEAYFNQPDPYDPASFYARLALEAWARHAPLQNPSAAPNECPRCGHAPQLGVLRPAGNGNALYLACSLCRQEWPYRRTTCPECGETDPDKLSYFTSEGYPWAQTQTCGGCQGYIHLLLAEAEPGMIPEVGEIALLAADVWAVEQGLRKIWPNLAGL
jgi:FdhE protein